MYWLVMIVCTEYSSLLHPTRQRELKPPPKAWHSRGHHFPSTDFFLDSQPFLFFPLQLYPPLSLTTILNSCHVAFLPSLFKWHLCAPLPWACAIYTTNLSLLTSDICMGPNRLEEACLQGLIWNEMQFQNCYCEVLK